MPKAENKKAAAKRGPTPAQHLTELVKAAVDAVAERRAASPAEVFCLRPVNPVRIVAAFSGGRDSTALVDILAKLYHKPHQTQIAEITVVHVHHGLSVNADAWAEHAKAMCEKWRLPLRIEKVYVNRQSPAGIEAAAREARYQTLKHDGTSPRRPHRNLLHSVDERRRSRRAFRHESRAHDGKRGFNRAPRAVAALA